MANNDNVRMIGFGLESTPGTAISAQYQRERDRAAFLQQIANRAFWRTCLHCGARTFAPEGEADPVWAMTGELLAFVARRLPPACAQCGQTAFHYRAEYAYFLRVYLDQQETPPGAVLTPGGHDAVGRMPPGSVDAAWQAYCARAAAQLERPY